MILAAVFVDSTIDDRMQKFFYILSVYQYLLMNFGSMYFNLLRKRRLCIYPENHITPVSGHPFLLLYAAPESFFILCMPYCAR